MINHFIIFIFFIDFCIVAQILQRFCVSHYFTTRYNARDFMYNIIDVIIMNSIIQKHLFKTELAKSFGIYGYT